MSEKVPIRVILGVDVDGKPHASRFGEHDAALVQRAAELMAYRVIRVAPENDELHGIAEKLPLGKIFATGRAFVPFVNRAAFDKLATLVEAGVTAEVRPAADAGPAVLPDNMSATDAVNAADDPWSKVEVGSVVLAAQPDLYGPGWWESVVVAADDDQLTLRWVDNEELEPFHRSRRDIALRHPGAD